MGKLIGIGVATIITVVAVWAFWSGNAQAAYSRLIGPEDLVAEESPSDVVPQDPTAVAFQKAIESVDIAKLNSASTRRSLFEHQVDEMKRRMIDESYAIGQVDHSRFVLEYDYIPTFIEPNDILKLHVDDLGIIRINDKAVAMPEDLRSEIAKKKFVQVSMAPKTKVKHIFLIEEACIDLHIPMSVLVLPDALSSPEPSKPEK